jgi:uncharacterized membrane protein YsdA (DUF1294 family)
MTILPYAVLLFGLASMILAFLILRHHDKYWMTEAILMLTIPIAITLIAFLLAAKVVPENTKELVAILAGIVGFVFGYASNKKPN